MKMVQIFSDLHVDAVHCPVPKAADGVDCMVVAGDTLIETARPELWVHGHVHRSWDYWASRTRIVSNPHGYGGENRSFNPALTVDLGR